MQTASIKWFLTPYLSQDCRIAVRTVLHRDKLTSISWLPAIKGKFCNKIIYLENYQTATMYIETRTGRGKEKGKMKKGKKVTAQWDRLWTIDALCVHRLTTCNWSCQVNKTYVYLTAPAVSYRAYTLLRVSYTTSALYTCETQLFISPFLLERKKDEMSCKSFYNNSQ